MRSALGGKSTSELSEEESAQLWAEEAQRRDAQMDSEPGSGRPAEDVFRDVRSRVRCPPELAFIVWPSAN